QIDELAAKYDREVKWHPFYLWSIAMKVGFDRPMLAFPIKGPYFQHDIPRTARLFGISPWNVAEVGKVKPALLGRAFYWLADRDEAKAKEFAMAIYHQIYSEAHVPEQKDVLAAAAKLGFDENELAEALESDEMKERYRRETDLAEEKGVFGSPFFIVDDEPFWGSDRLWMVEKWLADGGW
ncbi:MAG: DsbA family protein, partial [Alphaproteobacteria bacterium]|nr:DsbA family protein [Alphaproteobacteria bacterium]